MQRVNDDLNGMASQIKVAVTQTLAKVRMNKILATTLVNPDEQHMDRQCPNHVNKPNHPDCSGVYGGIQKIVEFDSKEDSAWGGLVWGDASTKQSSDKENAFVNYKEALVLEDVGGNSGVNIAQDDATIDYADSNCGHQRKTFVTDDKSLSTMIIAA